MFNRMPLTHRVYIEETVAETTIKLEHLIKLKEILREHLENP